MNNFSSEILRTSAAFKLDPDLVAAQVMIESGSDEWAFKPEPRYQYFWDVSTRKPFRAVTDAELLAKTPPIDFPCLAGSQSQEWLGQQTSWGLLQIMGAVARENGFRGAFLSELCDPVTNLTLGCGHLAELLQWAQGNFDQALAAYNGGKGGNITPPFRNQAYADKIMNTWRHLRAS